jgi:glycosyltransferase involved in cell wall biosynthesis
VRILFILPEYYPHSGGGISTYYEHYIKALKPHCAHIKVIVGSGYVQDTKKFDHYGVEVEYLDPNLYKRYSLQFNKYELLPEYKNNIAAAWAMWHQAKAGDDFDIVECTDFGHGYVPWVINHSRPVITRMHGSTGQIALHEGGAKSGLETDVNIQTEMALLPLCDSMITHSEANQAFWSSVFPTTNIQFIHPVYERIQTVPLGYKERDDCAVVTARVQKWKGTVELCGAVALLKSPITIKWYGRDIIYNKLQSTSAYLTVQYPRIWNRSVLSLPPKPNTEIKNIQQRAKFGIVPSVWDMFNFTCLEFMSAGTPVICSDGAGASGLITHGVNGFKYEATDIKALAKCIEAVAEINEDAYQSIATCAQQTIDRLLNGNVLLPFYIKVYNDVIAAFRPTDANVFIKKIYCPSDEYESVTDILNRQPFKKFTRYFLRRMYRKLMEK